MPKTVCIARWISCKIWESSRPLGQQLRMLDGCKCWAGNAVRQVGDGWWNADAAACQHWRPGCSAPTDTVVLMHSHTGLPISISIFSLCCLVCIVWLRGFCNKKLCCSFIWPGLVYCWRNYIVLQMAHSFTRAVQLCTTLKAPCFFTGGSRGKYWKWKVHIS